MGEKKTVKPRPHFYACILSELLKIAKEAGYNLVLHGSMNRDLDLIAFPWKDEPKPHLDVLQKFEIYLNGTVHSKIQDYNFTLLPGGRSTYIININRGGRYNNYLDEQFYIDIGFYPFIPVDVLQQISLYAAMPDIDAGKNAINMKILFKKLKLLLNPSQHEQV